MSILDQLNDDSLVRLVQTGNEVGRIYSIDYENALVLTNDFWKIKVNGIPQNAFLIATNIIPENYSNQKDFDKEIILLRVIGSCKLPQDDDNIRTKLDSIQDSTSFNSDGTFGFDKLTQNMLQFSGLQCRVLGTFYMKNQELQLGSDIENFSASLTQKVYMPKGAALETIVNYVDPIRKNKSKADFKALGIETEVKPFRIGTVRYTSSDRLQRSQKEDLVPVEIQPSDFLARRTAVLGMTRTGKSNMVKQTVSVVKDISDKSNLPIGQLVFDINGEYANANDQDKGSISNIFKDDCVRYRMIKFPGFKNLLNNFYEQIPDGFSIICEQIKNDGNASSGDIQNFMTMSFDEPDKEDHSLHNRWEVKTAIYRCLLCMADFELKNKDEYKIVFPVNRNIRDQVENGRTQYFNIEELRGGRIKLPIEKAVEWFIHARDINLTNPFRSSSGNLWLDGDCKAMLNMLAQKNDTNNYIRGYRILKNAKEYHSCERIGNEVYEEIYNHLEDGKIVILDLSVGNSRLRNKISEDLARSIFNKSMKTFTKAMTPPNIMIYIEEAHNLIGKKMDLNEPWPRLAKEGAKYKIGLVYATQEVSSVHPNILANTENWFVTHLNSEKEISELSKFYDFSDFSKSLIRAQDVGFARVKTLSSSYVIPVQIDKFDPSQWEHNTVDNSQFELPF